MGWLLGTGPRCLRWILTAPNRDYNPSSFLAAEVCNWFVIWPRSLSIWSMKTPCLRSRWPTNSMAFWANSVSLIVVFKAIFSLAFTPSASLNLISISFNKNGYCQLRCLELDTGTFLNIALSFCLCPPPQLGIAKLNDDAFQLSGCVGWARLTSGRTAC